MDAMSELATLLPEDVADKIYCGEMDKDACMDAAGDEILRLCAELEAARGEAEALRVDAYRYRWIRDGGWMLIGEDRGHGPEWPEAEDVDFQVDAAIDAAMTREHKGEKV